MQKQVSQRQRDELARRKAMPIALIQRPLKRIAARDSEYVTGADRSVRVVMGPVYTTARHYADAGLGAYVQRIARKVA